MELPEFLTKHAYGEIRLAGHRIGLLHVVDAFREGLSADEIEKRFPTLPMSLIHQVLAFYFENRTEADAYIAECQSEIERQAQAARPGPSLAEMRQRLEVV